MKNELGGLRIATEFVALKFKMYASRKVDKTKTVKTVSVQKTATYCVKSDQMLFKSKNTPGAKSK